MKNSKTYKGIELEKKTTGHLVSAEKFVSRNRGTRQSKNTIKVYRFLGWDHPDNTWQEFENIKYKIDTVLEGDRLNIYPHLKKFLGL